MDGWMREIDFTSAQAYIHEKQHRDELKYTCGTAVILQPLYISATFNLMYRVEAVDRVTIFCLKAVLNFVISQVMLIQNTNLLCSNESFRGFFICTKNSNSFQFLYSEFQKLIIVLAKKRLASLLNLTFSIFVQPLSLPV